MKCSFCGNELPAGASFCPECGTILNLDNDFVAPQNEAPAMQQIPAAPQPQPTMPGDAPASFPMPVYVSPYAAPETIPGYVDAQPPAPQPQPAAPAETLPPQANAENKPETEQAADADDMYLSNEKKKRGKPWVAAVVLVLAAVFAAFGIKSFLPQKGNTTTAAQPSATQSTTSAADDGIFWTTTTERSTEESTEDDTASDASVSEDSESDAWTDLNEATAPTALDDVTEAVESTTRAAVSTTREAQTTTTRAATTTTRAATTTTRAATTTTRAATTTTRAATTTTRAVTTTRPATTAAPTTTVQRPATTTTRRTLYVSEDGVALRTAPRQSAASLLSLSVGADVVVTGEENGYYYAYSNRYGVSGWVSKRYIGESRPVATSEQHISGVVSPDVTYSSPRSKSVASDGEGLNLRKGPGTDYGVIRSISDGYPVLVKGKSNSVSGWVYVTDTTHGVSGWVAAAYLK